MKELITNEVIGADKVWGREGRPSMRKEGTVGQLAINHSKNIEWNSL